MTPNVRGIFILNVSNAEAIILPKNPAENLSRQKKLTHFSQILHEIRSHYFFICVSAGFCRSTWAKARREYETRERRAFSCCVASSKAERAGGGRNKFESDESICKGCTRRPHAEFSYIFHSFLHLI
jgi:hypothetical protein